MLIRPASLQSEFQHARRLISEYADWLGLDLSFQHFEEELDGLPGEYAPPRGCLLLAWAASEAVGCVAIRPLSDDICEMKRLYVRPAYRGTGIGKELARRVVTEAQGIGYSKMRLDTLASMPQAPAFMLRWALGGFRPTTIILLMVRNFLNCPLR